MTIKPVEEIIGEIKEHYDEDPKGWRILRGRDQRGHYDTYISSPSFLWHMKTELKNPYQPVGVGYMVTEEVSKKIKIIMDAGDPLPFAEIYKQKNDNSIIAIGIGNYSPKSMDMLRETISSKQRNLESELISSLNKLLNREGLYMGYI
ncbi:MAG: hypothetical protein GKB99_03370 [Methanocellales archaeon]|nr:hypothetical protein [Methanocellales archaeon]